MTYIALEEIDFIWGPEDVLRLDELWKSDKPLTELAAELKRDEDEVLCLAMCRIRNKKIKPRPFGLFLNEEEIKKWHKATKQSHYVVEGKKMTLREMEKESGISYNVLIQRIKKYGYSPYDAMYIPVRRQLNYFLQGVEFSYWEIKAAEDKGITLSAIKNRLSAGYTKEEALTKPPKQGVKVK